MASGAPKMSPTKREYSDQFMPNWNSWTMPVTTPMAKLMRNSLPQNLRHPLVALVAGPDVEGLHDRDVDGQAEGQRHEEEVIDGGDPELQARQGEHVHLLRIPSLRSRRAPCRAPPSAAIAPFGSRLTSPGGLFLSRCHHGRRRDSRHRPRSGRCSVPRRGTEDRPLFAVAHPDRLASPRNPRLGGTFDRGGGRGARRCRRSGQSRRSSILEGEALSLELAELSVDSRQAHPGQSAADDLEQFVAARVSPEPLQLLENDLTLPASPSHVARPLLRRHPRIGTVRR